jgi:hypothetical protein
VKTPNRSSPVGAIDLDALQRLDPKLVALAHGSIDPEELEELIERAIREPAVRQAVEAFWPLDEATRQACFARAHEALVHDERAGRRAVWGPALLAGGAAAFLVTATTWVASSTRPDAPLPPYELHVAGGMKALRAESETTPVRWTPNAPLELIFRPYDPIVGSASAGLFVLEADGPHRLPSVPQVAPSGAVRWKGTVAEVLPGRTGPVRLVVAVRPGARPPTEEDVRRALGGERRTIRWSVTHLRIRDD